MPFLITKREKYKQVVSVHDEIEHAVKKMNDLFAFAPTVEQLA